MFDSSNHVCSAFDLWTTTWLILFDASVAHRTAVYSKFESCDSGIDGGGSVLRVSAVAVMS